MDTPPEPVVEDGDDDEAAAEDPVDEALIESFPASAPPAWWAGAA